MVGLIGQGSADSNTCNLGRMMNCMRHESFYSSGTYINKQLGVWIGWVNRCGSFTDCMPVWNETSDACLIFSGEHFGDSSEIDRLRLQGHRFDSENASYLVHLYEEMGLSFIEKLNGRFSGVLVDLRQQSVFLFNDRYGFDRIYYHENADGLLFSSEAKSLLAVSPELRQLHLTGLAEIFSCGAALQNRTVFNGISLLPGGSVWTVARNKTAKTSYFKPQQWESQTPLQAPDFYDKLKETFTRVLPRYFRGQGKIGMSLTGGLDGRMIMAWAKRPPGELPCYTFGSTYRDSRDVSIARRVARACNQPHETIAVGPKFFPEFPRLAEEAIYISDGAMDVAASVELYVNRIARRIAPVRLTGNYGSEIVRGNIAFKPKSIDEELFTPEFYKLISVAGQTYTRERQGNHLSFVAFKQVPWHHYSRLSIELTQVSLRSPYMDNELVSLMYQAPADSLFSNKPCLRLTADGNPDLARIPTDRAILYRRIPVLTQCLQVYQQFTFYAEYAYDEGMPQWVSAIDHCLRPLHLERLFLGRHKFYHCRVWYRDQLSEYVQDMLLDAQTLSRPYLNGRRLKQIVHDHISGRRNYTSEINSVLRSELIHRTLLGPPFFRSNPVPSPHWNIAAAERGC
jgi:asparagine synthase (glutamine-hydrolysing)